MPKLPSSTNILGLKVSACDQDLLDNSFWSLRANGGVSRRSGNSEVLLYREIAERMIGRGLFPSERCRYENGDKRDNRRENIEVLTNAESLPELLIDDTDSDLLYEYHWSSGAGGYAIRKVRVRGKHFTILMHREILSRAIGRPLLTDERCDHKNRNRLDNRRDNLRLVTHAQNCQNKGLDSRNKSGYRGVSFHKGADKWIANVGMDEKQIYCGLFETPEAAAEAAESKRKELNFLSSK